MEPKRRSHAALSVASLTCRTEAPSGARPPVHDAPARHRRQQRQPPRSASTASATCPAHHPRRQADPDQMTSAPQRPGAAPVGHLLDLPPLERQVILYLRLWCDGPAGRTEVLAGPLRPPRRPRTRPWRSRRFDELMAAPCATPDGRCMRPRARLPLRRGGRMRLRPLRGAGRRGRPRGRLLIAALMVRTDMALVLAGLAESVGPLPHARPDAALPRMTAPTQPPARSARPAPPARRRRDRRPPPGRRRCAPPPRASGSATPPPCDARWRAAASRDRAGCRHGPSRTPDRRGAAASLGPSAVAEQRRLHVRIARRGRRRRPAAPAAPAPSSRARARCARPRDRARRRSARPGRRSPPRPAPDAPRHVPAAAQPREAAGGARDRAPRRGTAARPSAAPCTFGARIDVAPERRDPLPGARGGPSPAAAT